MTQTKPGQPQDLLLAAQADTLELRQGLSVDFGSLVESATDVATDDEHDPDGATIAYERARLSTLITQADEHLAEIQAALDRIAADSYGRCETCGKLIGNARLQALPVARTCMDCADNGGRR